MGLAIGGRDEIVAAAAFYRAVYSLDERSFLQFRLDQEERHERDAKACNALQGALTEVLGDDDQQAAKGRPRVQRARASVAR